jgi:hypothetical protein
MNIEHRNSQEFHLVLFQIIYISLINNLVKSQQIYMEASHISIRMVLLI